MNYYLFLAIPIEHIEKARALGVAAWLGTLTLPEKGTDPDKADLILGLKTLPSKRLEFMDRAAFDAHASQMRQLVDRDGKGGVIEYPWLVCNWAVDDLVWRSVQQAIPTYSALNLFYWLIPFDEKREILTNHLRISSRNPKHIRRLLIDEIAKPRL